MKYALLLLIISSPVLAMQLKNLGPYISRSVELHDLEDVERRLNGGTDVNQQDSDGFTGLYEACSKGCQKIALLLLERGADPTILPEFAPTSALHNAIDKEMLLVVEAMLKGRIVLPEYTKKSYERILYFLCFLTVEKDELITLPTELIIQILQADDELCVDVLSLYNGNEKLSQKQKLEGATSVLGIDGVCRGLAKHCLPLIHTLFECKGMFDKQTAPEFARQKYEELRQPLPENGHFEQDYTEQRTEICELLEEDTFEQRLPGLIKKWFFTE